MNTPRFHISVNHNAAAGDKCSLIAGAAACDVSPIDSQFLCGYPHVPRMSTGVHDPLFASALYAESAGTQVLFIGCDVIFVSKKDAADARKRISAETGIPWEQIIITATHTHSGPSTRDLINQAADPAVPPTDAQYVALLVDGIVKAGCEAWRKRRPAEAAFAVARVTGIGTNRHDPKGVADPRVPILYVRSAQDQQPIALMLTAAMHPTVLHEDSTLVSGDFPGMARQFLQASPQFKGCEVVYHMGAAGNQSPRHVTKANTFEEATRLGEILGRAVQDALLDAKFERQVTIGFGQAATDELPLRAFPPLEEAQAALVKARDRFDSLRNGNAPRTEVRTAECDLFGAEKTVVLSEAAADGRLEKAVTSCLPAEIAAVTFGPHTYVAWPGEAFVEFGVAVAAFRPDTFLITGANGEFQGYLVTEEAVREKFYEAGNAVFLSPESGNRLVELTRQLLDKLPAQAG